MSLLDTLRNLSGALAGLPPVVVDLLATARKLGLVADDLALHVDIVRRERSAAWTHVYVLPPPTPREDIELLGWPPMMARAVCLSRGQRQQVEFDPQVPYPAGTWLVAVGSARVVDAKVGNQLQGWFDESGSQVSRLTEPAMPGTRITLVLVGDR